jgi:hypothetical protein
MCVQTIRPHHCRHCPAEWTHPDDLELCPEGERFVLKHGWCAPIMKLLEEGGHHVSVGRAIVNRYLEDMCDDCKEKHFREWELEARSRQTI